MYLQFNFLGHVKCSFVLLNQTGRGNSNKNEILNHQEEDGILSPLSLTFRQNLYYLKIYCKQNFFNFYWNVSHYKILKVSVLLYLDWRHIFLGSFQILIYKILYINIHSYYRYVQFHLKYMLVVSLIILLIENK